MMQHMLCYWPIQNLPLDGHEFLMKLWSVEQIAVRFLLVFNFFFHCIIDFSVLTVVITNNIISIIYTELSVPISITYICVSDT